MSTVEVSREDIKKDSIGKEKSISPEVRVLLLKKWRGKLTRYSKLRDNGWIRISIRGNTTIRVDCNKTKDFYLKQIQQANIIIEKLTIPKQ